MQELLKDIRSCTVCKEVLPHPPRPIVQFSPSARLLIVGQAPGSKVHASGVPWDDASGDRLRDWLGMDTETFYGNQVALLPMGFCYPGKGKTGDLAPRPECAPLWHKQVLERLPNIGLTLLIGKYAQDAYLVNTGKTLTATVANFDQYLPNYLPLPHPSPRNNIWIKKNVWFTSNVIPTLKANVAALL